MQSADPDANAVAVAPKLEAANDDALPVAVGALAVPVPVAPLGERAAAPNGDAGWDPFEVWRTRIRDARRVAREPDAG